MWKWEFYFIVLVRSYAWSPGFVTFAFLNDEDVYADSFWHYKGNFVVLMGKEAMFNN